MKFSTGIRGEKTITLTIEDNPKRDGSTCYYFEFTKKETASLIEHLASCLATVEVTEVTCDLGYKH